MKIIYIGESDSFSAYFIDRHVKEGNSVSIISNQDFTKINKPKLEYKWYNYQADSISVDRIFSNIKPQQVVFAGSLFGVNEWSYEQDSTRYLSELLNILNLSNKHLVSKFIFLSSTEIYKNIESDFIDEKSDYEALTYKGILSKQGEILANEFSVINPLNILILRFSDLYGYKLEENKHDFLSELVHELQSFDEVDINKNLKRSPIHISDAVEALFRCEGNTPSKIYNVASSKQYNAMELALIVKKRLNVSTSLILQQGKGRNSNINSNRIKSELEWSEFNKFEDVVENMQLNTTISVDNQVHQQSKKDKFNPVLIHFIENIVFFIVMASLSFMFKNHSILKNVDLMTIYIVSISLFFGIRQSILSIILTFAFYLFGLQFDFGNFIHIILNADTFLKLSQYIFMGVVVGYTVDQFRTSQQQTIIEKDYLETEYSELKEINDANILIKHQYEKRLISYKSSLPRLYAITNQLDSLNPEVLFSSIIKVLVDVLETETVSVYSFDSRSGYARLISAKNEESIFMGKSFKLSDYKELESKLLENDVYIGNQWADGTPSMAGPIFHKGNIIAIILIKSMTFESLNLYQVNLLRTLTSLISSSFIRAYQYEEKIHNEKYLDSTEVLITSEFKKLIDIKQNDTEQSLAEYTLLRFNHIEEPISYYYKIVNLFRSTDYFGIDSQDRIHVLLRNTNAQDIAFVEKRLDEKDIHFEIIDMNDLI